jgi:hypothetical protein
MFLRQIKFLKLSNTPNYHIIIEVDRLIVLFEQNVFVFKLNCYDNLSTDYVVQQLKLLKLIAMFQHTTALGPLQVLIII